MMQTTPRRTPPRTLTRLACASALLLASTGALRAQEETPTLPDSVAREAVARYNASQIRMNGTSEIAPGITHEGDIALLDGTLRIAGTVTGDVTVINGDLEVTASGNVLGSALVVGGVYRGDAAGVRGGVQSFAEPLRYRFDGPGIALVPERSPFTLSAGRDFAFGRTDFLVATRDGYNRVEGMPIALGPRARLGGSNPTVLEALFVYRTERPLDLDRHGWAVRAEQYLGGRRAVSLGARLRSEILPIEKHGLSDLESSLATFLLHQDYRDHYHREGWSLFLRAHHPDRPLDALLEYRDERHTSTRAAGPLSVIDNGSPWRPEPAVAEGPLRAMALALTYDTRNDVSDPAAGWFVTGEVEQGVGGRLERLDEARTLLASSHTEDSFTHLQLDMRRYLRLSPYARLAIRLFAAGSVDGEALPPQRQHALGGEGSLPGYPLFALDCGARSQTITLRDNPTYPYYGCDRAALLQLEYQANFPYARRLGERLGLGFDLGRSVRWAVFFDAGRAWIEPDEQLGRSDAGDDVAVDAGLGIRFGPFGIYGAVPLSGSGHDFNFFIRLGQRL